MQSVVYFEHFDVLSCAHRRVGPIAHMVFIFAIHAT